MGLCGRSKEVMRMDKRILEDYIDACEFIKETEAEIKKLEKRKRIVQDKVRGSNPEFPYEERSFNLGGTIETVEDASALAREKQLLEEQRRVASNLKLGVEEWMQQRLALAGRPPAASDHPHAASPASHSGQSAGRRHGGTPTLRRPWSQAAVGQRGNGLGRWIRSTG